MNGQAYDYVLSLDEDALKQMFFIYNAVKNGYTVKMINNNTISFKIKDEEQQVSIDNFVTQNKKLDKIFKFNRR